jgi:hypothetical protein
MLLPFKRIDRFHAVVTCAENLIFHPTLLGFCEYEIYWYVTTRIGEQELGGRLGCSDMSEDWKQGEVR